MAQRALDDLPPRKRQIAIMRTPDGYVTIEPAQGMTDFSAYQATGTLFLATAGLGLVLAVIRKQNPGATVFFYDADRAVIRIH